MDILKNINGMIAQVLSKIIDNKSELKVWQKCDRYGNSYWLVYDPVTSLYSSFSSEQELRIWIEERYYRHPK